MVRDANWIMPRPDLSLYHAGLETTEFTPSPRRPDSHQIPVRYYPLIQNNAMRSEDLEFEEGMLAEAYLRRAHAKLTSLNRRIRRARVRQLVAKRAREDRRDLIHRPSAVLVHGLDRRRGGHQAHGIPCTVEYLARHALSGV